MIRFPEEWRVLSQPWVRSELMEFLKSAMDTTQTEDRDELRALVHFIFDGHDFTPDAANLVGVVLFDIQEAELVNSFINAFDRGIGPGDAWPEHVGNLEEICRTAKVALGALMLRGTATFSP